MAGKTFISYRREDVAGDARGIRDALAGKFGRGNVFMDVDDLLAGRRFDVELAKALDACDVLIAVIGPRWMGLLKSKTASGERDYVRAEIAAALERGIIVIPVRVGQEGRMPPLPRAGELPEDIRDFVLYQKHDVVHERFGRDVADLIAAIQSARRGERSPASWGTIAVVCVTAVVLAGVMLFYQRPTILVHNAATTAEQIRAKDQSKAAAKRKADDAQRQRTAKAEEDQRAAEAKRKADEEERQSIAKAAEDKLAAEAKRKADEEERQRIANAAEERAAEARRKARQRLADKRAAEAKRKADEEERQRIAKAAEERAAQAKRKADEEERQRLAMLKADQDRAAELARKKAEADLLRPGRVFRDCPDVCPEMVVLPAGEFMMGSPASELGRQTDEGPQRRVTIQRPFAVGKFEVTFAGWDACVAAGACKHRPGDEGWGRGGRPVINVSWHDAKEYAAWLTRKTGKSYRLLSEAEWEYAARAGTTTWFAFGDTISKSQAQYSEGKWGSAGKAVEVGSFPANRFGLHDMHGNVWEWVEDAWHPNYEGAPDDGSVLLGGDPTFRVLRGGSWDFNNPAFLRSANRSRLLPIVRNDFIGFRVARTL